MSTKMKAFIGILISFIVLIILFTSTGGYRASRGTDVKKEETCSVEENHSQCETISQSDASQIVQGG